MRREQQVKVVGEGAAGAAGQGCRGRRKRHGRVDFAAGHGAVGDARRFA